MKPKTRRFDVGGDVRARALRFAALADKDSSEESEGQKEMLRKQAGREYGMTGEEPAKSAAPKPTPKPTPKAAPAPGKFTDSDEDARAMRRAAEEDENAARIARARSEEENESNIRQGRMKAMEREQALERSTPELDVTPIGKVARFAKTAAGAAAAGLRNRAKDVETAAAKAFSRPQAREVGRYTSPAEARQAREAMETANKRAGDLRSRQAASAERTSAREQRKQTAARNEEMRFADEGNPNFKKGGSVSAASRRADGCAQRGNTRGKFV
jgi:hypothetical protein